MSTTTRPATGDAGEPADPGAAAASAVALMRSTAPLRAAADAVELQAVATLAWLRRQQALDRARDDARDADVARGLVPGTTRPAPVDLEQVDRMTAQEVSLALTLSPVVARGRLELAVELVGRRPVTFEALRAGEVDLVRARRICDAVRTLPRVPHVQDGEDVTSSEPLAAAVESEALYPGSVPALADRRPARPAGELTPAQLTARLARLVLRVDPDGAADRTAVADTRRGCSFRMLPDGMALLSLTGRAELLGAAFTRLDGLARQLILADAGETGRPAPGADGAPPHHDAARTLDQTRVDVFLATVLGDSHDLSRAHGVTVDLSLVATAGTVLAGGDEPGDLDGYGPVPAPLARALAADARWRRWETDPGTGHVVGVTPRGGAPGVAGGAGADASSGAFGSAGMAAGTPSASRTAAAADASGGCGCGCGASSNRHRTYRPSAAVAELIRARDRTCRFPTCRRRAAACDLDHVVPFPEGPTCPTTMATECRLHHTCKHRGGFGLTIAPDGTTTWTTPTGQTLVTHPPSWGRPPPGGWTPVPGWPAPPLLTPDVG